MTIISKDALAKPYAALDVSVYTSILTSEQKIGIISRYLSYCWAWPWPSDAPVGKTRAETNALRFIEIRSRLVTGMATEGRKELSESHSPDELFLWADKTLIAMKEIYVSHHAATKHADIRQKWEDLRNEFKIVVQKSDAIPLLDISPWGLLHRFRQHFIYDELRAGPLEVLQPLAPNEKFEVVLSETRSSTWEETVEKENEVTRDESVETHDENELTDRVANMLSKTATRTLSASGSTNWITGSASGNASETVADSSSRAVETTTRRLQEITKKQAEQIKQKVKITTRLVETQATSSTTRHVIENKSNSPVNYGLRRLYYDVNVKLQDLGPVLVWQTIVHNPGQRLAMPVLVDDPRKQDLPELPVVRHGVFTGQDTRDPAKDDYARTFLFSLDKTIPPCFTEKQKVKFQQNSADVLKLHLNKIRVFSLRGTTGQKKEELRFEIAAVSIDNAFRLSIAGRVFDRSDHFIMAEIELAFEVVPTQEELKEAEETIAAAKSAAAIKYIEMRYRGLAQLERDKLEYEERKILLGMALAQLVVPSSSQFPDLEAALAQIWENLDRVFDWSQMFYRQDVLEWREMKRIAALTAGTPKQYEIHSLQKHAAPLGSSLNWDTQLDGDDKRNAFLNAPWIKVCIPVKEGSEETALQLLKSFGVVSIVDNSAAKIQCELKAFRTAAKSVSRRNIVQDMAVTKNTPIAEQIRPWLANCETMSEVEYEKLGWYDVYPIISQQHVVIPVNGYMFDEIVVDNDGKWNDSSPRKSETRRGWWWNFLWS